jgi:hypothetical protein
MAKQLTPEMIQMACDVLAELEPAAPIETTNRWHSLREELESLSHEYGDMIQQAIDAASDVLGEEE